MNASNEMAKKTGNGYASGWQPLRSAAVQPSAIIPNIHDGCLTLAIN